VRVFSKDNTYMAVRLSAPRHRSVREEIANSVTHGIGLALSVAGLALLVVFASLYGTVWHVVGSSIYGATLVVLFTASTLYHSARTPKLKHAFKVADHCCIFLLIAGTYTPYTITNLRGGWGWALFGVVWGFAVFGIVFKVLFVNKFRIASSIGYVVMGWLVVIAIKPMVEVVPLDNLMWLAAGGIAYTAGLVFYATDHVPYSHTIWHMFVLTGSFCHYYAVMACILQLRA